MLGRQLNCRPNLKDWVALAFRQCCREITTGKARATHLNNKY
jgi:hypothetical protein